MKQQAQKESVLEEIVLEGIPASPGIVIGNCAVYREQIWHPDKEIIDDPKIAEECRKFRASVQKTLDRLRATYLQVKDQFGSELAEILETQIAFLEDDVFLSEIEKQISENKFSAAYATYHILSEKREYFSKLSNEYFRDRALDIYQLKKMLLSKITGKDKSGIELFKQSAKIVVADNLTPHDTVRLHRYKVLGFATNTGGKMSHTAIVARSLGVPAVVGLKLVTEIASKESMMILDGNTGKVILNPCPETITKYQESQKNYCDLESQLLLESMQETATKEGKNIEILANMEFEDELPTLQRVGAQGIGLFRTEGLFLHQNTLPLEDEQAAIYSRIAENMFPRKVIIRTLDLGGDKVAPNLMNTNEENPFLGWRAIRFWLDHKTGFLRQLKAILRANLKGNVQMMIPMVSGLSEIRQVKELMVEAADSLRKEGKPFNEKIDIGIMIEIPSAVILADVFAQEVDFFSIGTNDLVQYTLAVDRGNDKVARLYSHFHPAVLRMIRMTIDAGKRANIPVGMCGEMASDPRAIPLLLAMGFEQLSASPNSIPQLKRVIRELSLTECATLNQEISVLSQTSDVVRQVNEFFESHFPELVIAGKDEDGYN